MTGRRQRVHPWLRAALVLYLISAVLVIAVHQHRDARQSHDCALCTVAHMPGALPADPAIAAPPADAAGGIPNSPTPSCDSGAARACPSRAPPQA